MTNLFSTKQIVGICFLIIGLSVYLVTGFNFDVSLPTVGMPAFNPFEGLFVESDGFSKNPNEYAKQLAAKYKNLEELQNAINSGEIRHDTLPGFYKSRTHAP